MFVWFPQFQFDKIATDMFATKVHPTIDRMYSFTGPSLLHGFQW